MPVAADKFAQSGEAARSEPTTRFRRERRATTGLGKSTGRRRANRLGLQIASIVVFLGIWQIVGSQINPILLATPSRVWDAFVNLIKDGTLGPAFLRAM